jgi:hypothetical protein
MAYLHILNLQIPDHRTGPSLHQSRSRCRKQTSRVPPSLFSIQTIEVHCSSSYSSAASSSLICISNCNSPAARTILGSCFLQPTCGVSMAPRCSRSTHDPGPFPRICQGADDPQGELRGGRTALTLERSVRCWVTVAGMTDVGCNSLVMILGSEANIGVAVAAVGGWVAGLTTAHVACAAAARDGQG